jgi:hypothetical protein
MCLIIGGESIIIAIDKIWISHSGVRNLLSYIFTLRPFVKYIKMFSIYSSTGRKNCIESKLQNFLHIHQSIAFFSC